jgi:hypothetical protein
MDESSSLEYDMERLPRKREKKKRTGKERKGKRKPKQLRRLTQTG